MQASQYPKRPRSLREVSSEVNGGRDYSSAVKEFTDELVSAVKAPTDATGFYDIPTDFYLEEPETLENPVHRAHIAGMAENLARLSGIEPPLWTEDAAYFLKEPVYFGGRNYRQDVTTDTPAAFRRRLLFSGPSLAKLFRLKPRPAL